VVRASLALAPSLAHCNGHQMTPTVPTARFGTPPDQRHDHHRYGHGLGLTHPFAVTSLSLLRTMPRHLLITHQGTHTVSTANCSPTLLPTTTLSVAIGLFELARECLYAKHGGLVRSLSYRSWSTGLSDPRLVGLTSASLVVWHRSSSPTLKYWFKYRTEVDRPLRKSTVPIFDRDTDPYRFRVSIKFTDLPTLVVG